MTEILQTPLYDRQTGCISTLFTLVFGSQDEVIRSLKVINCIQVMIVFFIQNK
ncbi:hypothetical protein Palpr_0963 [Paludibacter propionicigenes WB4]|uniref:Uncharacterized protein n=1 Tax=Paludibacter propionicigenes (strain DSM 17365 / JCM 13257 / WB4) TaxID=694427 RepID=E4T319_PALPW|nr:hypothetical protein Palpr_0963 [Paludibacter propionicigenes WB4]